MENNVLDIQSKTYSETDLKNLFDDYYNRLVYFSYQIINNKPQAEDIAQDAFVKFWDNCNHVSSNPVAIKNFLYSTVKNASLNVIRHNKVAEQHMNSLHGIPADETIFHTIIRTEVLAEIYQAIELLPGSCQQIFRMSYLDDMKNHQIADVLGISVNTVKTQKQRALKVLRGNLSPELFVVLIAFSCF
ncbi:RNA polymerase sigma-70 factor [Mucilaginibacter sp. AW1-7]|uniref:RNA polymerase sigma-70 factor n=1 Tax=Mucilaginibacter sp. AW1-7 TaxID=3349874 RepID=UPI003F73142D